MIQTDHVLKHSQVTECFSCVEYCTSTGNRRLLQHAQVRSPLYLHRKWLYWPVKYQCYNVYIKFGSLSGLAQQSSQCVTKMSLHVVVLLANNTLENRVFIYSHYLKRCGLRNAYRRGKDTKQKISLQYRFFTASNIIRKCCNSLNRTTKSLDWIRPSLTENYRS